MFEYLTPTSNLGREMQLICAWRLASKGGTREAAHTQRYHAYSHTHSGVSFTPEESPRESWQRIGRKFSATPEGHQKVWQKAN